MKPEKFYNSRQKREQWRIRFMINRKRHYVTADTLKELNEIVDEMRGNERRARRNLDAIELPGPKLSELFDRVLAEITNPKRKAFFERVFKNFLERCPKDIRIKKLKKSHFQSYINWRAAQTGYQSKKPVKNNTIYKEIYMVSGALNKAEVYWSDFEDWVKPKIPKNEQKKSRQASRRKRRVDPEQELKVLLAELRKPREGKQTYYMQRQRERLADDLEFRYETGLRRKEVAMLEKKKYFPLEHALRDVERFKTGTTTPFFPLTERAEEIIRNRIAAQNGSGSEYIFTPDGKPRESDYRLLKNVCKKLDITYGRFTDNGFVPHDLRHAFASEIVRVTDIESARELLGHSNIEQTGDYLHTDEKRLRDAMRRKEGADFKAQAVALYVGVKRGKIKLKPFVEKLKKLSAA